MINQGITSGGAPDGNTDREPVSFTGGPVGRDAYDVHGCTRIHAAAEPRLRSGYRGGRNPGPMRVENVGRGRVPQA